MWICVNCWEVLLSHETKMEHLNARHLLTSSLNDSASCNNTNFLKLCRIYGKVNPEETHVVLLYVPNYVKDAVKKGICEMAHVTGARDQRESDLVKRLMMIRDKIKD